MDRVAILALLEAKPGREKEVEEFLKSALPLAELAFAIYFSYFVVYAIMHRQFLSVPFLVMFQAGFLYVFLSSVLSGWSKFNLGGSRARATIPA